MVKSNSACGGREMVGVVERGSACGEERDVVERESGCGKDRWRERVAVVQIDGEREWVW